MKQSASQPAQKAGHLIKMTLIQSGRQPSPVVGGETVFLAHHTDSHKEHAAGQVPGAAAAVPSDKGKMLQHLPLITTPDLCKSLGIGFPENLLNLRPDKLQIPVHFLLQFALVFSIILVHRFSPCVCISMAKRERHLCADDAPVVDFRQTNRPVGHLIFGSQGYPGCRSTAVRCGSQF